MGHLPQTICMTILYALCILFFTGDISIKPFVSAEPEFTALKLSGQEDFLVLACDGLWDYVSEDAVALEVYKAIKSDPGTYI